MVETVVRPDAGGELPSETRGPSDPYRWLEEDSPRTHAWLRGQQRLIESHSGRTAELAWRSLLVEIQAAAAGRLLSPPREAGGLLFRHEATRSGSQVLTVTDTHGFSHVLLDTCDHSSETRVAAWHTDPLGRVVLVQLHHEGHENGGLYLFAAAACPDPEHIPDAAPHTAVAFLDDSLLYCAGTRTEHVLRARSLHGGPTRTLALPVPGPVRLSLHSGPGGHLLLRTRKPQTLSARWWCTHWNGRGRPDWQPLPLDHASVTAFALGYDHLFLVADDELSMLRLSAVGQGNTAGPAPLPVLPAAARLASRIRALRVLGPAESPYLAVLRQFGPERRLDIRRMADAGETTAHVVDQAAEEDAPEALTWHGRLRLGPSSHGPDGSISDALWILADDPLHGCWDRRVIAGTSITASPGRSVLRIVNVTSEDGATVPVTVCDPPPVVRVGPAPTLVTVYGGFGVPLEPSWDPIFAAWLAAGGRIAWVHARGGGELGPDWAAAGRGPGKSRAVDDLSAAARSLLDRGEAGPGQLAALAASNGGLVLAAAMVRTPGLFSAIACAAPLTDMARYHVGGLGRLWSEEYGDPEDPAALRALLAYSPYHQVHESESYPATLLITGGNDARVPPWHAWKLCAALQEATSSREPILLDHQGNTGHQGRAGDAARTLGARVLALLACRTGLTAPLAPQPPEEPERPSRSAR
ncbi:prolyl oligopeptidase family serine peptidase [Streptomyces sp. CAS3]